MVLESNLESQESSKDAYKQHFEIGQRSLLDMLDGVNKYFVMRNSLLNAQIDLKNAEQQALAAIGIFLTKVGIAGAWSDIQSAYELALLEKGACSS